ncbi:thioredoxin [Planococcaceae bacterium Storch 2/2-2]|nr:thioredoxin [Planococcaceae bacterium Storch 2/2-2]
MEKITSFEQWQTLQQEQPTMVLYVKVNDCSVCEGLYPQVEPLQHDYPFPFYQVNASEVPEMAGQLSLFTAPVVVLFLQGKEYTRFARFIPMEELKKRLDEIVQWEA